MAVGVIQMYVDGNIAKFLRLKYGQDAGTNIFYFFEEWRNYGIQYIRKTYPERTLYTYIDKLIEVGLAEKVRYGVYRLTPGWDKPLQGHVIAIQD